MLNVLISVVLLSFWHIADYNEHGIWSHDLHDGRSLLARTYEYGEDNHEYGEVLYRGSCNLANAVELWENSPTHNEVINEVDYDYAAILMIPDPHSENECIIIGTFAKERK